MIKKALLIALFSFFFLIPKHAFAANQCGVSMTEIPHEIGTQISEVPLRLFGMDTSGGASYYLLLTYHEPVEGKTGNFWSQPSWRVPKGEEKTLSLGKVTGDTFLLTKAQYPQAFFMDGNPVYSDRKLTIVKNVGTTSINCDLQSYQTRSSAVAYVISAATCGDGSTVGKRGTAGGCVENQICKTDVGEGWWCECDDECEALQSGTSTGGTGSGGSSGETSTGGTNTGGTGGAELGCKETTLDSTASCNCPEAGNQLNKLGSDAAGYCCGWKFVDACYGTVEEYNNALMGIPSTGDSGKPNPTPSSSTPITDDSQTGLDSGNNTSNTNNDTGGDLTKNDTGFEPFEGPNAQDFADLNPLKNSPQLHSPGGIVSRILTFAFPLAGLILFVMIVWGGFEMLVGATGKGIDAGKQRVTNAIIGFFLLFIAYWVFQIVEVIFGIQIV